MYKKNVNSTFIILTQRTVNCRLIEFVIGLHENAVSDKNVGMSHHPNPPLAMLLHCIRIILYLLEVKTSVL